MQTIGLCPDLLNQEFSRRGPPIFVLTNSLGGLRIIAMKQQKANQKYYKDVFLRQWRAMERNIRANTPQLIL